ncbi:hypothetical protein FE810_15630 [Thalassotalea litorea]|uniref:Uncharacterized protein n=1 Tax=Thalassotalea litorea TaxID=2020715 RepID=A0A5R9IBX2_9GAMM|nr:hypothetical protein [Thalassotalea litorea]TLU61101.1 hypothetical protein FE810_15630 [Thalassotalea litorea]
MDISLITRTTIIVLALFSLNSNAADSKISCNQIKEFQPKLIEFDKKYRSTSKEYLAIKRSSDGWVMEAYLFVGEHNGKYVVSGLGNQASSKEVTIPQKEFASFINKFQALLKDEQFNTTSDTEHNHCTQLIIKTPSLNYDQTKLGLSNNLSFNRVVRELDYYIFL